MPTDEVAFADRHSGVGSPGTTQRPAPRVLHLRSSCGFYGAEGVIYNLVRAYRGDTLTVCFSDSRDSHTELTERLAAEGCATLTIPSAGAFDPSLLPRFAAVVKQFRPDVVHAHEYKSDAVAWAVARILPLRRKRLPLVGTMHGVVRITSALRRYERLDARVLRRFDAVVPVSAGTAEIARQYGVPERRIHLVSNGIDTELFHPVSENRSAREALGLPQGGLVAGVVGRLSEEKGHAVLLDALAALQAAGVELSLAVVGDGPLEAELRTRALAVGIAGKVFFLGRRDDMPAVYPAFDLLVLPSYSEGLPLTVLEAAACGLPVVGSDVGDVRMAAPDGESGLMVPPGDASALAASLRRIVEEPGLRDRLAGNARRRVEQQFSAGAMAAAYESVYRTVAGWPAARSEKASPPERVGGP